MWELNKRTSYANKGIFVEFLSASMDSHLLPPVFFENSLLSLSVEA